MADIEKYDLDEMIKGWFIGNFEPTLFSTTHVEVGIKKYKKGDVEKKHFHKIATEFTVIISGKVQMNGIEYKENEIVKISPGLSTDFFAMEDTTTVVVKVPGANNDKYEVD
jgi:hypothetical protein